jgi:hypothetical protein
MGIANTRIRSEQPGNGFDENRTAGATDLLDDYLYTPVGYVVSAYLKP